MNAKKDFDKKYREVIFAVAVANHVDVSVGSDMLVSSIKGHAGMTYGTSEGRQLYDEYDGIPENFNYRECLSDWFSVVKG